MKKIFAKSAIFILLCIATHLQAQEEVTFNNLSVASKDIKATQTVSGFSLGLNPNTLFGQNANGYLEGSIKTYARYFHENRLGGTFTLNKSIGLINSYIRDYERIKEGYFTVARGRTLFVYRLGIEAQLEPRWYFNARTRYRHNKSILNNSGWFVSVPFTLNTTVVTEPLLGHNANWTPDNLKVYACLPVSIGYRKAFSEHWMIEGNINQAIYGAYFWNNQHRIRPFNKIGLLSSEGFNSELRVAYTF